MNDEIEDLMSRLRQAIARALIAAEAKGRDRDMDTFRTYDLPLRFTHNGDMVEIDTCCGKRPVIGRAVPHEWTITCPKCGRTVFVGEDISRNLSRAAKVWNREG